MSERGYSDKAAGSDEGSVEIGGSVVAGLTSGEGWHRHDVRTASGTLTQVAHRGSGDECSADSLQALLSEPEEGPKGPDDSWPERPIVDEFGVPDVPPDYEVNGPDPDIWGTKEQRAEAEAQRRSGR